MTNNTKIKTLIRYRFSLPVLKEIYKKRKIYRLNKYLIPMEEVNTAEDNDDTRKALVDKYRAKWPSHVLSIENNIRELNKKYEINTYSNENDILFCCLAYGFQPDEYYSYNLWNKNGVKRKTFLSDRDVMMIVYRCNDVISIDLFNDKIRTYEKFNKYYKREAISISNNKDYEKYLSFIKDKPCFVKKIATGAMGRGVELVKEEEYLGKEQEFFLDLIRNGDKYLLEELVIQHKAMSILNSSSVNTIRLISFNTYDGVIIPYSILAVGRNGSFVNNGGSGGLLVGIDIKTGITNTGGWDEAGRCFDRHPDTNIFLKGFEIPEFDTAKKLCKSLSEMVPDVKYIGWDFAYTSDGWAVIEGNGMSQLIGPQCVLQRGIKNEVNTIIKRVKV